VFELPSFVDVTDAMPTSPVKKKRSSGSAPASGSAVDAAKEEKDVPKPPGVASVEEEEEEEEEEKAAASAAADGDEADASTGVLDKMKGGTTFMKYGKFGRPKYRMFQLTKDHRYLVWFSPKKDQAETRIPIKYVQQIKIGKESEATSKSKSSEVHETSFTVVYGKTSKKTKSLTVTAKNEKKESVSAAATAAAAARAGYHFVALLLLRGSRRRRRPAFAAECAAQLRHSRELLRWVNEVRETTRSPKSMVSFHGLHLLYKIHKHDRRAVIRMVTNLVKSPPESSLARCLLIRYVFSVLGPEPPKRFVITAATLATVLWVMR